LRQYGVTLFLFQVDLYNPCTTFFRLPVFLPPLTIVALASATPEQKNLALVRVTTFHCVVPHFCGLHQATAAVANPHVDSGAPESIVRHPSILAGIAETVHTFPYIVSLILVDALGNMTMSYTAHRHHVENRIAAYLVNRKKQQDCI
jgi:hypothetical protein